MRPVGPDRRRNNEYYNDEEDSDAKPPYSLVELQELPATQNDLRSVAVAIPLLTQEAAPSTCQAGFSSQRVTASIAMPPPAINELKGQWSHMLRSDIVVDEVTQSKLNPAVLDEIVSCLWPKDCQTCGWSLGREPCALVVDDSFVIAHATLHHRKCKAPNWNDSGLHEFTGGPLLSWIASGVFIPSKERNDPATFISGIVLNPSLEMVSLRRGSEGSWELSTLQTFRGMGFTSPSEGINLGQAVPNSSIVMTPTSWRVHLPGGFEVYEVGPEPEMNKHAISKKGILAIITQAADPANLQPDVMPAMMMSKHTVAGWVPLYSKSKP